MEVSTGRSAVVDAQEEEIQVRLAATRVGIWMTVIVCIGVAAYALATWHQPNRSWIMVLAVLGLLSGSAIAALPMDRIVRSRWREILFATWTITDIVFVASSAALDGGTQSPLALLLVLPFLYGALSYPLRVTTLIGAVNIFSYVTVAILVGGGLSYSALGAFALICVAVMASWESRNQGRRRVRLADTVLALHRSEATSRLRAQQQREVARLGQLALEGTEIDELTADAYRVIASVLGIEVVAVLKLMPGGEELLLEAGMGMPDEAIGTATVPIGRHSQSGYALEMGEPVVVENWETESRFEMSQLQADTGMRSAATVLIKAKGEPYGILGAGSTTPGRFDEEDVAFMQALSNVIANAIERRSAEEHTRHEALHDPLTGLPNRNLFLDRLTHALAQAERHSRSVAVLFLDLDQFKLVNDSLGHAAGDELLASVAPRIEEALRPSDTVARFGGDEFAVLAEEVATERDAIRVAERIAAVLTRPFILRGAEHFASASIGISISLGGEEPEALIRDADAAMYRAKDRGRGGYEIFDAVMRSRVIDHMQTENDLRRATQRGELELHYQPILALRDQSTVMYEALLRWQHPERGMLVPAAFIPVAEESRLIVPIGRWVIEEACRAAAAWQALDPDSPPVGVSVNLSARQLADPELLRCVEQAVDRSGIEPSTLRLELTESTLFEEVENPELGLQGLHSLGVRIVLDDFGTGFSSLGYLKRLPLSGIKLDRGFVENLAEGGSDAAILRAATEMAAALGLDVCAEGIETAEQLEAVQGLGCSHAQGFHFGRPIPAGELMDRLAAEPVRAERLA